MADYLLDGRLCPMLPLDGNPRRAVYFYKSTEGAGAVETRITNNLLLVPDDNGASWTAADCPTGAHLWLRVPDETPEQEVLNRLLAAHANKEKAVGERLGGATHGEGTYDPSTPFAKPGQELDTRETWEKLGFASRADWKAAGKPQT